MAVVQLNCPHCRGLFQVDSAMAGGQVTCPHCRQIASLPSNLGANSAAAAGNVEPPQGNLAPPAGGLRQPPGNAQQPPGNAQQPPGNAQQPPATFSRFNCPMCSGLFQISAELAGGQVSCPHCRSTVTLPATSAAQPTAGTLPQMGPAPTTSPPPGAGAGQATTSTPMSAPHPPAGNAPPGGYSAWSQVPVGPADSAEAADRPAAATHTPSPPTGPAQTGAPAAPAGSSSGPVSSMYPPGGGAPTGAPGPIPTGPPPTGPTATGPTATGPTATGPTTGPADSQRQGETGVSAGSGPQSPGGSEVPVADNRYPPGFRPAAESPSSAAPSGGEPAPASDKSSAQVKSPSYMYPPGFEPQQPSQPQEQPIQSPATENTSATPAAPANQSQQRPVPAAPYYRPGPRATDAADTSGAAAGPTTVPISAEQMRIPSSHDIDSLLPPRAAALGGAASQAFVSPAMAQQLPLPVEGGPLGGPMAAGGATVAGEEGVAIPTAGGVVAVREPTKTVEYDGEEVELRQLTPAEKRRRRLIKNLVMAALGILFLIVTALILVNL